MKGGIGQLMKQAQEMQANMKKAQEEMASITVTGESGAGMVKITMSCQHQVRSVEIDDTLVGDDKEMLEDLIVAAFNDSIRKVEKTVQEKFSGMASGRACATAGSVSGAASSPLVCSRRSASWWAVDQRFEKSDVRVPGSSRSASARASSSGSARSSSDARSVGSCHAWGSTTSCSTSGCASRKSRRLVDVGMAPKRRTTRGACALQKDSERNRAS